jgi:hypothetical protein
VLVAGIARLRRLAPTQRPKHILRQLRRKRPF